MKGTRKVKQNAESSKKIAMRVSILTILGNLILSLFKLVAGIFGNSAAMISDAIHSASDVFSTLIVMLGFHFAEKEADEKHPYGHERFESIASIILALILLATGVGIGFKGITTILSGNYEHIKTPGIVALIAAIVSILAKEFMYHYTARAAKKINSGALLADAWHHRSDSLSSIGALIGIIGSRLGFLIFDPLASIIICLFIIKVAFKILKDAFDKMVDKSAGEAIEKDITEYVLKQPGVIAIDLLKTRLFGSKIFVDIEILVDGNKSLYIAHEIAENVHDRIEESFTDVKHCMVHVNPK